MTACVRDFGRLNALVPGSATDWLHSAVVVVLVLLLGHARALAAPPRHVVLFYISETPISENNTRPLIAYVDRDGTAVDWMFDGIIVMDNKLGYRTSGGVPVGPTASDLAHYKDAVFDPGGQLRTLALSVAALRTELGDPSYKLAVYLDLSYPVGSDPLVQAQNYLDRWNAMNLDGELELAGFYWGYEEGLSSSTSAQTIHRVANWVHAHGYELTWIPYFNAPGVSAWKSYGFDRVNMQPGYAFTTTTTDRFRICDDDRAAWAMSGLELELVTPNNANLPTDHVEAILANARAYLDAANRYGWSENALSTYYHGSMIGQYRNAPYREIYDRLYGLVSVHPRKSLLPRIVVTTRGDGFTERAADRQGATHGDTVNVMVGTNGYPNSAHAYWQFDDPGVTTAGALYAAHLKVAVDYFPYGTQIDDLRMFAQDAATWNQATLAGNNEPALAMQRSLDPFRLRAGRSQFAADLTNEVLAMRGAGRTSLGLMMKRDTEDGTLAQAAFWSAEAAAQGLGEPPRLELVLLPAASPPDDPGVVPPGDASTEPTGTEPTGCSAAGSSASSWGTLLVIGLLAWSIPSPRRRKHRMNVGVWPQPRITSSTNPANHRSGITAQYLAQRMRVARASPSAARDATTSANVTIARMPAATENTPRKTASPPKSRPLLDATSAIGPALIAVTPLHRTHDALRRCVGCLPDLESHRTAAFAVAGQLENYRARRDASAIRCDVGREAVVRRGPVACAA